MRAYITFPLAAWMRSDRYERTRGWFESNPGVQFILADGLRRRPSEGRSQRFNSARGFHYAAQAQLAGQVFGKDEMRSSILRSGTN